MSEKEMTVEVGREVAEGSDLYIMGAKLIRSGQMWCEAPGCENDTMLFTPDEWHGEPIEPGEKRAYALVPAGTCKWKKIKNVIGGHDDWATSCDNIEYDSGPRDHCPFCGKPIEVEDEKGQTHE